jgi:hypothetical protein
MVASCFLGIVIFTVTCETLLKKSERWIKHFNPLLKPCADKIYSELMILGIMSFCIQVSQDIFPWEDTLPVLYDTLQFVDNVIFFFALVYILQSVYILILTNYLCHYFGRIEAHPIEDLVLNSCSGRKKSLESVLLHTHESVKVDEQLVQLLASFRAQAKDQHSLHWQLTTAIISEVQCTLS